MITKKDILKKIQEIASITGEATSEQEAIEKQKNSFLMLDHNSVYGGYRIVTVNFPGYSETGAFGGSETCGRLNAKDMYNKLCAILTGLEMAQTLK